MKRVIRFLGWLCFVVGWAIFFGYALRFGAYAVSLAEQPQPDALVMGLAFWAASAGTVRELIKDTIETFGG